MQNSGATLLARYIAVATGIALATERYRIVDDTFRGDDLIAFTWSENWNAVVGTSCSGERKQFYANPFE